MSVLVRYVLIALVIVVGMLVFSVCAEGLCDDCVHTCCTRLDRSRMFQRIVRGLACACRTTGVSLGLFAEVISRGLTLGNESSAPAPRLSRLSALRI